MKNPSKSVWFVLSVAFVIHFAFLRLIIMAKGERVGLYGNKRASTSVSERVTLVENENIPRIQRNLKKEESRNKPNKFS